MGNKYKFLDTINSLVSGKKYDYVIEMFMGSGNILLNIDVIANKFCGNDKIKLLPNIYKKLSEDILNFNMDDVEKILNNFNRFSEKDDYYTFRDYWNKKYLTDNFDREFIMETILLLKMCSNSMVRFNPKEGYFNQGFRGLGTKKEFFTETMKNMCVEELNLMNKKLNANKYRFFNKDFSTYKDKVENSLLIIDPPYILRHDMYDLDWTESHDKKLFDLLNNTKNDFIYFNYIERDGVVNQELVNFIKDKNLQVIEINGKTLAGQGRSESVKEVKEVIITNLIKE